MVSTVRPNRNCVSIVQENGIVASSGFAILRPKFISSEYLWTFCKTNYFQMYLKRRQRNTMYPAVSSKDVLNCPIFETPKSLQIKIKRDISKSVLTIDRLTKDYLELKTKFQLGLGFRMEESISQHVFTGNYRDINEKMRIDVSYYIPIYKHLNSVLNSAVECISLQELLQKYEKGIEVGSTNYLKSGVPFLRVSNINTFNLTRKEYVSEQTYRENKSNSPRRGEILLSKDATLGLVHYIDYEIEPMLVSSGIIRMKIKESFPLPYYLAMVLDTQITKLQLLRESNGSILRHFSVENLKEIKVPLLTYNEMKNLNNKLKTIFKSIKECRQLQNKTTTLLNSEILSYKKSTT